MRARMYRRGRRRTAAARRARCRLGGATPLGPSDGVDGTCGQALESHAPCLRKTVLESFSNAMSTEKVGSAPPHVYWGTIHARGPAATVTQASSTGGLRSRPYPRPKAVPTGWRWHGARARPGVLGGTLGTAAYQCGWRGIDTGAQQDRSRWRLGLTLIEPAQSAGCVRRAATHRVYTVARAGRSRRGVVRSRLGLPAADFQGWGGGAARGGGLPHAHARPPGQRGGQAAAAGPARGTSPATLRPSRRAAIKPHLGDLLVGCRVRCRITPCGQRAFHDSRTGRSAVTGKPTAAREPSVARPVEKTQAPLSTASRLLIVPSAARRGSVSAATSWAARSAKRPWLAQG